ncbi:hypothetical protein Btru_066000 [Bulinus truncatus]|nr:hypothetical protein Btru_066000 [Bulinus truncatus]
MSYEKKGIVHQVTGLSPVKDDQNKISSLLSDSDDDQQIDKKLRNSTKVTQFIVKDTQPYITSKQSFINVCL